MGGEKLHLQLDEPPCDLSQIYDDFRALERENWITSSPGNTWQTSWTSNPVSHGDADTSQLETDAAVPPIPPRTSSWNLSTPNLNTELHIPESPVASLRRCHSPCVLADRKCGSPFIVRKFEAMLQENEGKFFKDGALASCSVPANPNCNVGCCHNRWSCDASKFTHNKLSAYETVQKSFSEVNIPTAHKDLPPDYSSCDAGKLQTSGVQDLPLNVCLSPVERPVSPGLQGSRRNLMLERKTAEFNRTLFQAEMGHRADVQSSLNVTGSCSAAPQTILPSDDILPRTEISFQPICPDVSSSIMDVHPEVSSSLHISNSTIQNPEELPVQMRYEAPEVRIKAEPPPGQLQAGLREATVPPQSPELHDEAKHKVQTARSPSRKCQQRAATEPLFSESQPTDNTHADNSPSECRPPPTAAGVSHQQPSDNRSQVAQPRHQSDSSRPALRLMNDHPWKPLTLAAYPRLEGSRSNYGAVERILKNYESAARAQQNETAPGSDGSRRLEDTTDTNAAPLPPTHVQTSYGPEAPASSCRTAGVKEVQLLLQVSGP